MATPLPTPQEKALAEIQKIEKERAAKTKAREMEVRGIMDEIIAMYSPQGQFGQGTLAMLERQRAKDLSSATQSLVTSGMFGTTMAAGLGKKWEEEIGMPTRAKLEDVRYQAYAGAMGQKAGMVERIAEEPIDYATLSNLMMQAYSAPTGGGIDRGPPLPTLAGIGAYQQPTYQPATTRPTITAARPAQPTVAPKTQPAKPTTAAAPVFGQPAPSPYGWEGQYYLWDQPPTPTTGWEEGGYLAKMYL